MLVAVTGGTGFLGRHLVPRLRRDGHRVKVLARGEQVPPPSFQRDGGITLIRGDVSDREALEPATVGVDAIAHLAGINAERGKQTFERVHEEGTQAVVDVAEKHAVDRLVLVSYLRARPAVGSGYFESKWTAEQLVRGSTVPHTILKPAAVFGPGDQLLTNLARWLHTFPILPIPAGAPPLRPVAVEDLLEITSAALNDHRLRDASFGVLGAELVSLSTLATRIARFLGRREVSFSVPTQFLAMGATLQEIGLERPFITSASLRMLAEGMVEPEPSGICRTLPDDLAPQRVPSPTYIREALESPKRLGVNDLRFLPS